MAICFLCNVDVPPKSRVCFKNMAEEPMEPVREILAKKYSDEKIMEASGKEPVACRGKYIDSSIADSTNVSEKQLLLLVLSMKLSSSLTFTIM